jgi:hypothetical protein
MELDMGFSRRRSNGKDADPAVKRGPRFLRAVTDFSRFSVSIADFLRPFRLPTRIPKVELGGVCNGFDTLLYPGRELQREWLVAANAGRAAPV